MFLQLCLHHFDGPLFLAPHQSRVLQFNESFLARRLEQQPACFYSDADWVFYFILHVLIENYLGSLQRRTMDFDFTRRHYVLIKWSARFFHNWVMACLAWWTSKAERILHKVKQRLQFNLVALGEVLKSDFARSHQFLDFSLPNLQHLSPVLLNSLEHTLLL